MWFSLAYRQKVTQVFVNERDINPNMAITAIQ